MSFKAIVDYRQQCKTDDGHPIITIAHHEPMAKVSEQRQKKLLPQVKIQNFQILTGILVLKPAICLPNSILKIYSM